MNEDYKNFTYIASLKEKQLIPVLENILKNFNYNPIKGKYSIMAKGDIPIVLVAHLDTVFYTQPERFYFDQEQTVVWAKEGLGADDRAGVYGILKILKAGYRPCIAFTFDEESKLFGAIEVANSKEFFDNIKYVIELDRQGEDDCVFYKCYNSNFIDYIESFGFKLNLGTYSDISFICEKWGIAGVNLSIGYEDEHSFQETLNLTWFNNTINKVKNMLDNIPDNKFIYISKKNENKEKIV